LLTSKLHSVFQSEVIVGRVTTSFPLNLIVKDLEVKSWFKVKKVFAGMGIIDILEGNFILSDLRLEGIEFELEKKKRGEGTQTPLNLETVAANVAKVQEDFFLPQHIILKRLIISNGTFTYIDHTKGEIPIKIPIKDLNVKCDNFQWPFRASEVTELQISGKVPWENIKEQGRISLEGWINFYKKDMNVKVKIKDIDGVYIYPYYSSWIDIDKARVEKARLDFSSDITGLNNEVNASCHLEMTQLTFKPKEGEVPQARMEKITNVVVGILKALNQGRVVLDFNFKTKMDNPEFGLGIIQQAFKDKLDQVRKERDSGAIQIIKFPGKIIEGTITSAVDLTRSVINGTVNVGKEFRKAVEVSFTREANVTSSNDVKEVNQTK